MALKRDLSEKPLVLLEAGELLGMRQLAQVSTGHAGARAEMSKVLSKIGAGETPAPARRVAVSRADMSKLLSKIGEPAGSVSRAELSRLLSKIGEVAGA